MAQTESDMRKMANAVRIKTQTCCPVEFNSWIFIPKMDVARLKGMKIKTRTVTRLSLGQQGLSDDVQNWLTYTS
jgi:hypothetical protein